MGAYALEKATGFQYFVAFRGLRRARYWFANYFDAESPEEGDMRSTKAAAEHVVCTLGDDGRINAVTLSMSSLNNGEAGANNIDLEIELVRKNQSYVIAPGVKDYVSLVGSVKISASLRAIDMLSAQKATESSVGKRLRPALLGDFSLYMLPYDSFSPAPIGFVVDQETEIGTLIAPLLSRFGEFTLR